MIFGRRTRMLFWQLAISSEMIGRDAHVALEVVMMIANLQTLGTPISYTSISGTVAAAVGVMLIPTLGIVMDRWGQSRRSKAKILSLTTFILLLGSISIFFANGFDLFLHRYNTSSVDNSTITPATLSSLSKFVPYDLSSSISRNDSNLVKESPEDSSIPDSALAKLDVDKIISALQTATGEINYSNNDGIPWTAYLAMVGYAVVDHGIDLCNCFLKTFLLDCAPTEFHSSVLLKSILISSVGGILIAVLGSINLGHILTSGTDLDPNAALCCFLAALSASLLIVGFVITLLTGFFWTPPLIGYNRLNADERYVYKKPDTVGDISEQERLMSTTSRRDGRVILSGSRRHLQSNSTKERSNSIVTGTETAENGRITKNGIFAPPPRRKGWFAFFRRQKEMILVNMMAFSMCSCIYSFVVYSVNFVGEAIFRGDPSAPKGSAEYLAYLDGVAVGSQGFLIYYIIFAIFNLFHEKLLTLMGWKIECIFASLIFGGLTLAAALTLNLWVFYVTISFLGIFRAVAISVPFILANQLSVQQNEGKSSGAAMAFVTAMLPAGFLVCAAIMGPLINVTGNPAASVYYATAFAFLNIIFVVMLRS